jgi:DNA invertase Pin-like site-specific DNA recombinase
VKSIAYVRVSDVETQDTALQRQKIEETAKADGNEITTWYTDEASAWKNVKRPGLDKLLIAAESRKHQGALLYIFALSRLTRKGARDTFQTLDRLALAGVQVKSCTESYINTTDENPFKDVIITLFATVAKLESEAKSARMKAWVKLKRTRGERIGRKKKTIDTRKMVLLKKEGKSWREIAIALGISRSTVKNAYKKLPKETTRTG